MFGNDDDNDGDGDVGVDDGDSDGVVIAVFNVVIVAGIVVGNVDENDG